MEDNSSAPATPDTDATAESSPQPEMKPSAVTPAEREIGSILGALKSQGETAASKLNEIEQVRLRAEKAQTDIDAQIAAMSDKVATFNQQVEAAQTRITELTSLVANLQATINQTQESSAQATGMLESLRTLARTASDSASRIEALKTQVEQAAQVAATRSKHIEEGRTYVDEKRDEVDKILNAAQLSATNAKAQYEASKTTTGNLDALYAAAQTTKANIDSAANAVNKLEEECKAHAATSKRLADIAEKTEQRVGEYEARLGKLEQAAADRLQTIEGLLPGAASAGLASAFNQRREAFKWPQRMWQWAFIVSLLALFAIAGVHSGPNGLEFGLLPRADAALSWNHLGLSLLYRLPFALPLVWLAFHSSHRAALAQRIEEDYGFKETVSRSFEGYRREMSDLEGKVQPDSPLARLCSGVLGVVTNPPGRIYEKQPLNKTPLNAVAESTAPIAEAAVKVKPAGGLPSSE